MEHKHRKLHMALFCVYGIFLLHLLFCRTGGLEGTDYWAQIRESINLHPFLTIRHFVKLLKLPVYKLWAFCNLVGNVAAFIPLGFFLPRFFPKLRKFSTTLLASALIMTVAELVQLFTLLGYFDIDDLILNLLGTALGYGFFKFFK